MRVRRACLALGCALLLAGKIQAEGEGPNPLLTGPHLEWGGLWRGESLREGPPATLPGALTGLPIRTAEEAEEYFARQEEPVHAGPALSFSETHPLDCSCAARRSLGEWLSDCGHEFRDGLVKIGHDFRNNYTGHNLCGLGLALAIAAPLANTQADENFHRWYQKNVRSSTTRAWSKVGNKLGEHWVTVPFFVGAAVVGKLGEDYQCCPVVGTWGTRSIRALIVGSPAVGALQYGLGAGRPGERDNASFWRPFNDKNSVAGHGFVGAVPFLAAASMTEYRPLRALFFAGSFWTCWSRIDTDSHYLSQAILGWSIAYLATRSVAQTDREWMQRVEVVPLDLDRNTTGIGFLIRY